MNTTPAPWRALPRAPAAEDSRGGLAGAVREEPPLGSSAEAARPRVRHDDLAPAAAASIFRDGLRDAAAAVGQHREFDVVPLTPR